ncbi:MAG: hypothetical protein KTR22_00300 [Flavobacteriaceae bacterium]|nr:hypothetical protein [Flavobacteriaceae bacterium]
MKMYLLVTAFMLQVFGYSYAQEVKSAEEVAGNLTELMSEKLTLDEEQKIQVQAINELYAEKQMNLMHSGGSKFYKMREMKELNASKTEKLKSVLSDEQLELYEDEVIPILRERMKKQMKS